MTMSTKIGGLGNPSPVLSGFTRNHDSWIQFSYFFRIKIADSRHKISLREKIPWIFVKNVFDFWVEGKSI